MQEVSGSIPLSSTKIRYENGIAVEENAYWGGVRTFLQGGEPVGGRKRCLQAG